MKKYLFLFLLIAQVSYGQISTQSKVDGSIIITPKGITNKDNLLPDTSNVAIGASALLKNVPGLGTGYGNTAGGNGALRSNTLGSSNTATGYYAMYDNQSGSYNTATGAGSLRYNTLGIGNTAAGYHALNTNSTGTYNTSMGVFSLNNNMTGNYNTANGYRALHYNSTGNYNTASGMDALFSNNTGRSNTAMGTSSLYNNTSGLHNTAVGDSALFLNSTGHNNTAIGYLAMQFTQSGYSNTAIGIGAFVNNISGNSNVAIGSFSGINSNYGDYNTYLGPYTGTEPAGWIYSNSTAIGSFATINASNKIRLGNDQVTVIEGAVPFSSPSDRRLKQNINPSLIGLAFITRLSPMSYTYIADKTNIRHDGLIAQDVEKVMQELGVEFSGLHKSPDGTYSLAYSDFVMPLVNAVKELKQKNEELEARLSALEELKAEITKLKVDNTYRNSDKK